MTVSLGCKESVMSDRLRAVHFKSKQLPFVEFGTMPIADFRGTVFHFNNALSGIDEANFKVIRCVCNRYSDIGRMSEIRSLVLAMRCYRTPSLYRYAKDMCLII